MTLSLQPQPTGVVFKDHMTLNHSIRFCKSTEMLLVPLSQACVFVESGEGRFFFFYLYKSANRIKVCHLCSPASETKAAGGVT